MTLVPGVIRLKEVNENVIQMLPWNNSLPEVYRLGIEFIKTIRQIESPGLTALMKIISFFGSGYFFTPIILFIFWCIDEKKGLRMGVLILVSAWINSFLKSLFRHPRPFNIEPSLGLATVSGYGFPSGHAQMSFIFFILAAVWFGHLFTEKKPMVFIQRIHFRRIILRAFTSFIILAIGFTRLYLGVHFPTDVLAGWLLGSVILAVWFIPGPFLTERLVAAGIRAQNISVAAAALIMNGLLPADRTIPAAFLGFCIGYNMMKQRFPFSAKVKAGGTNEKSAGIKILFFRCLVGFAGMAVLFLALTLVLPGEKSLFANIPIWGAASPFYETGLFILYGIIGFWASAAAPRLFMRMGLAQDAENAE